MSKPPRNAEEDGLIADLRRAREQQAATQKILEIISQNRDDEQPVFDLIVKMAKELCGAKFAGLVLGRKGDEFQRVVASENLSAEILQLWKDGKYTMERGNSLVADAILNLEVKSVEDMGATHFHASGDERYHVVVTEGSVRSNLIVPLVLNSEGIGCLMLGRDEVRPYTPDQVLLIETFATQAVIAIENVRQFREVQERLERETATGEVLSVISRSRDDEQPVFDVILENAANLCNAPHAFLQLRDNLDTHLHVAAQNFRNSKFLDGLRANPIPTQNNPGSISVRSMEASEPTHYEDIRELRGTNLYTEQLGYAMDDEGMRTALFVPLTSGGQVVGIIVLYRLEVAPFRPDEIALVETFAAQAVIAIENVRQFRELQTRLEREAASREILGVISRNREDEQPVFDVILESAARLCDARLAFATMVSEDGGHLEYKGSKGEGFDDFVGYLKETPIPMDPEASSTARAVIDCQTVSYDDYLEGPEAARATAVARAAIELTGVRSVVCVPLIRDGIGIGSLTIWRTEERPFAADQIALVETFAAQAVIAIENVRQFKALETLNAELGDRVESQVGEIERMGRLKRFLPSAVADVVVTTGDESMLSSHRALIATLFCDMRGFTAFCEAAEPEETIEVLQTYHQEMSELIDQYGGGVDQRAGDGIMVIFNDPIPVDDPAGDTVRLALAMRKKMRELCTQWKKLGHRLGFGIGISLGYATVGMVGSAGRFDYTASGTSVNTAARLCDMAANEEILISPRAWAAVEGEVEAESRGEVEMKGIREPVEIFAVVAD